MNNILNKENAKDLARYVQLSGTELAYSPNKQELQDWLNVVFGGDENPVYTDNKLTKILTEIKEEDKHFCYYPKKSNLDTMTDWFYYGKHDNVCCHAPSDCMALNQLGGVLELAPETIPQHLHNEAWGKDINEWYKIIKPFLKVKFDQIMTNIQKN